MVKYAITMGIRMVCLASIFLFDGWYKLIPVIGAVLLPWVAVVIANGGADIVHRETVDLLDEAPMYAVAPADPAANGRTPRCQQRRLCSTGEIVPERRETESAGNTAARRKPEPGNTMNILDMLPGQRAGATP